MTRRLSAVVLCLLSAALIAHSASKTLEDLKAIYDKEAEKIEAAYQETAEAALNNYGKWLGDILESMKKKGDVKGFEATKKEQERFEAEKTVPDDAPTDLPELIMKAQSAYRQEAQRVSRVRDAATLRLVASYSPRLEALKKQLMSDERLDEAKGVQGEIERIGFVAADIESKMPKAEPKPEPKPDQKREDQRVTLQDLLRSKEFCEGMVLYYPFDGDKKHSVEDRSGKRNHGKVEGAEYTQAGKVGSGRAFDGMDDQIALPIKPEAGHTIAGWIKPSTPPPVDVWGNEGDRRGCGLVLRANGVTTITCDSTARQQSTGIRADAGEWHHVVQVFGHDDTRTYINGDLKNIFPSVLVQNRRPFLLGRASFGGFHAKLFHGTIDEVMIWNRSLTEAEVKQLYEATK